MAQLIISQIVCLPIYFIFAWAERGRFCELLETGEARKSDLKLMLAVELAGAYAWWIWRTEGSLFFWLMDLLAI